MKGRGRGGDPVVRGVPARDRLRERAAEVVLLASTLVLVAFYYLARADAVGTRHPWGGWWQVSAAALPPALHYGAAAVLLAGVPVLVARLALGLGPRRLGLGPGRWRLGLAWLGVGLPLAVAAGRLGAGSPAMAAVYPLASHLRPDAAGFLPHALGSFLYFGAWEVFFRGFVLFGLAPRLGEGPANGIQTALSVVAHFGRPLTETLSAIPAGLLFGWIDLRVRSVWYIAIVHWAVGISVDWFLLMR